MNFGIRTKCMERNTLLFQKAQKGPVDDFIWEGWKWLKCLIEEWLDDLELSWREPMAAGCIVSLSVIGSSNLFMYSSSLPLIIIVTLANTDYWLNQSTINLRCFVLMYQLLIELSSKQPASDICIFTESDEDDDYHLHHLHHGSLVCEGGQ